MNHSAHQSPLPAVTRRRFLATAAGAGCMGLRPLWAADRAADNPVLLWNERFISWVKAQTPPPALTARNLAILHLAQWKAALATGGAKAASEVLSAAVNAASHEICSALFPTQQAAIAAQLEQGGALPEARHKVTESARRIAREVTASRAADGSSTTIHYVPKDAPGQWRRTPPAMRPPELPHWGSVVPFLLKSPGQFRPPPPPDISGDAFAKDLAEVRDIGGKDSTTRTAEESETAHFWSDFSYSTSPPGHWNDIARQLAAARGLGVRESARLFALLNLALADAGIACWECKYHCNFWRPVTALNRDASAKWQPLLATPPHPEYVSGHSAFSGAAAAVLESFFGANQLRFSAESDTMKNITRRYTSLNACAEEISRSRVLGGIHFPSACREGLTLGRKVGQWALMFFK